MVLTPITTVWASSAAPVSLRMYAWPILPVSITPLMTMTFIIATTSSMPVTLPVPPLSVGSWWFASA
jgi:hypothetical protein